MNLVYIIFVSLIAVLINYEENRVDQIFNYDQSERF